MEDNSKERAALYKKLNAFRADVIQCDWKDDKMVSLGGNKGYPYLSSDKIIKNLAPLLVKHGIELDIEYSDLTNHTRDSANHWSVKATICLTDVDTGYTTTSCAYGEGYDSQDKGIAKAQTAAFKKCLSARNMIADGIDPDAVDITTGVFFKKTPEEQEEIKSKVLSAGVKPPSEPKPVPKVEEIPVQKEPVKKEPVQTVIEEPKPTPETKSEEGKKTPKYVPMGPQKGAMEKILAEYERRAKAGEISVEDYNQMSMDYVCMESSVDAMAFIRKYRV